MRFTLSPLKCAVLSLLIFAFGALLVGCAVLTVDVDVYKGALVNDARIQTEQLAAMAMAARPLLMNLDRELELEMSEIKQPVKLPPRSEKQQMTAGPDLILPNITKQLLRSNVNNLLVLYTNMPKNNPDGAKINPSFRGAYSRLKAAFADFDSAAVNSDLTNSIPTLLNLTKNLNQRAEEFLNSREVAQADLDTKSSLLNAKKKIAGVGDTLEKYREANTELDRKKQAAKEAEQQSSQKLSALAALTNTVEMAQSDLELASLSWKRANEDLNAAKSDESKAKLASKEPAAKVAALVKSYAQAKQEADHAVSVKANNAAKKREIADEMSRQLEEAKVFAGIAVTNALRASERVAKENTKLESAQKVLDNAKVAKTNAQTNLDLATTKAKEAQSAAIDAIKALDEQSKKVQQLANQLQETAPSSSLQAQDSIDFNYNVICGPLEIGRPTKGLGLVISEYLDSESTNYGRADICIRQDLAMKQHAVMVSVVDFAQKVKFLADNAPFESGTSHDLLVLESIGNAILSLADAIERRNSHEEKFTNAINQVEWQSLNAANKYLNSAGKSAPTKAPQSEIHITETKSPGVLIAEAFPKIGEMNLKAANVFVAKTNGFDYFIITNGVASIIVTNVNTFVTNFGGDLVLTVGSLTARYIPAPSNVPPSLGAFSRENVTSEIRFKPGSNAFAIPFPSPLVFTGVDVALALSSTELKGGTLSVPGTTATSPSGTTAGTLATLSLGEGNANSDVRGAQERLIQTLRDIQITAKLNGDKARAEQAQDALDLALAYRCDSIGILPSMNYLRNGYPATSLQQNNGNDGLWHNMLAHQGLQSLPHPLGEWLSNGTMEDYNKAKIQSDIDKQFWQNINRVRVAGSGMTSYVITKDDIGNWYVKNFTADPKPIIEGAQAVIAPLAVANAAGKAATTITSAANTATSSSGSNATSTAANTTLGKEFGQITNEYSTATIKQGIAITNFLLTLNPNPINAAFPVKPNAEEDYASYTNTFTRILKKEGEALEAAVGSATNVSSIAAAEVNVLYQLRRFDSSLSSNATYKQLTNELKIDVRSSIKDLTSQRSDAVRTFSTQLRVLANAGP